MIPCSGQKVIWEEPSFLLLFVFEKPREYTPFCFFHGMFFFRKLSTSSLESVPATLVVCCIYIYMAVSKNIGTPKWMVFTMENPIKIHDLGVPLFLETPIQRVLSPSYVGIMISRAIDNSGSLCFAAIPYGASGYDQGREGTLSQQTGGDSVECDGFVRGIREGGIWVFPKIMVPPHHPLENRVFHYFHHPFWGFPLFLETPI